MQRWSISPSGKRSDGRRRIRPRAPLPWHPGRQETPRLASHKTDLLDGQPSVFIAVLFPLTTPPYMGSRRDATGVGLSSFRLLNLSRDIFPAAGCVLLICFLS